MVLDVLFAVALIVNLQRGDDSIALDGVVCRLDGFEHLVDIVSLEEFLTVDNVDATLRADHEMSLAVGSFDPAALGEKLTRRMQRSQALTSTTQTSETTSTSKLERYRGFDLYGTDYVYALSEHAVMVVSPRLEKVDEATLTVKRSRATATETERRRIAGDTNCSASKKHQVVSRVRRRLHEELVKDVEVYAEHHPELLAELRNVVCDGVDAELDR